MKYELHLAIINSFKPKSDSNLYLKSYFFKSPFRPAAKVRSNRGQMAWMPFEGQPRLERVWPDRDLAVLLTRQGLVRGGFSWLLLLAVEKK
jgi:hypothetical protein